MDLMTFLGLPEGEQWEEFCDYAIFLSKYRDIDITSNLFRLYDFYVELTVDSGTETGHHMNAFIDGPRLDKYRQADIDYINEILSLKKID